MDGHKVGEVTQFGGYAWRVLAREPGAALLITEQIIERRAYHSAYSPISWHDCALRAYLNGEFLQRFSPAEQAQIIARELVTPDNAWYGSAGGAATRDRIFLLSVEDVACHFFGDSSALLHQPRRGQRYWFERKDANNALRVARFADEAWGSWWWLRTPGRNGLKAAYVHGDGNIGIQGNNILKGNVADGVCTGGVRPALWLSLRSAV